MARPATKTPKIESDRPSLALEQLAQTRSTRLILGLIIQWMKETEDQNARLARSFDQKLDAILSRLTESDGPPPQLGVRLERFTEVVEQLAQAVESRALASDSYSVQACEVLGLLRREVAEVAKAIGATSALPPVEPIELAIGERARPAA